MAKRLTTDSALALLRQLRAAPTAPETLPALEKLLSAPNIHGLALKSAATLAASLDARSLAPALTAAITSHTGPDAAKRDPGCEAKIAMVRTLLEWDADLPDLFLTLSRYTQAKAATTPPPTPPRNSAVSPPRRAGAWRPRTPRR
jgi:hypothetical protein